MVENDSIKVEAKLNQNKLEFSGSGNGPIDAMIQGINEKMGLNLSVTDYHQHSLGTGSDAKAVAYIEVSDGNKTRWGVGIDENTIRASLRAIMIGFDKISI